MEIYHPIYGWIPFAASPSDGEQLGIDLYAQAIAGSLGPITPYVAPALTAAMVQATINKMERDAILPRPVREFLLLAAIKEATALGLSEPQLYVTNNAYKKVKDFDASIVALRLQMESL